MLTTDHAASLTASVPVHHSTTHACPLCTARGLTCDGDCLATLHKTTAPKEGGADNENCQNEPPFATSATGPRTPGGKAVAARNATTHGLFSRDVVLPSLGEDPEGYRQLEKEFMAQLDPRTLVERYYVEQIAGASWRLRRLHRWQAQLFEDENLNEDQRLDKLDKVLRHETALRRQVDTAVRMIGREVPQMYKGRARDQALLVCMQTEVECRENRENELEVEYAMRERLNEMAEATAAPPVDLSLLDTLPNTAQNCQNEPSLPPTRATGAAESSPPLTPPPPVSGGAVRSNGVGSDSPKIGGGGDSPPTDFGIMGITRNGYLVTSESARTGRMVRLAPRDDEDLFR